MPAGMMVMEAISLSRGPAAITSASIRSWRRQTRYSARGRAATSSGFVMMWRGSGFSSTVPTCRSRASAPAAIGCVAKIAGATAKLSETEEPAGVPAEDPGAVRGGQVDALQEPHRILVAHVEAVVAAEHHPVGPDQPDQVAQGLGGVADRV